MTALELKNIGLRIAKRRRQIGLTQETLAEKMNVSVQMISNVERGNKAVKIENLIKISDILGITADYILKGSEARQNRSELSEKLNLLNEDDYGTVRALTEYLLKADESRNRHT